MNKDTFYFSHDYNTRNDFKIKQLIRTHGMNGYGVFWAIIEDLYQNNNELLADYSLMSYDLRVDENLIKSIINDFGLFVLRDSYFGSISVEKRLLERDKKSKTAKDNARKRWDILESRTKANSCIFYILRFSYDDEFFIKCGITTESISRRYSGKSGLYVYSVLYQIDISTQEALELEGVISSKFNKYQPKRQFGGYLECYNIADESEIIKLAMQRECKGNAIKERKRKEKKEKEIDDNELIKDLVFISDEWKPIFITWLKYKAAKKETYKSNISKQACITKLQNLSNNNLQIAKEIVEQSMANNYSGLFELKATTQPTQKETPTIGQYKIIKTNF